MTKPRLLLASIAVVATTGIAAAQDKPAGHGGPAPKQPGAAPTTEHAGPHVMTLPSELQWTDAPPSLPKGARWAVIEGDPSKPGPFTLRIQMPAKYKIPPHTHPAVEHVTVLSGELWMGSGEKLDEAAAKKLTPGGFAAMPAKYPHFAFTKKKAEIQLHGVGPWGITYINPADDPRNASAAAAPAAPAKK